jgi:hypothetical protein
VGNVLEGGELLKRHPESPPWATDSSALRTPARGTAVLLIAPNNSQVSSTEGRTWGTWRRCRLSQWAWLKAYSQCARGSQFFSVRKCLPGVLYQGTPSGVPMLATQMCALAPEGYVAGAEAQCPTTPRLARLKPGPDTTRNPTEDCNAHPSIPSSRRACSQSGTRIRSIG